MSSIYTTTPGISHHLLEYSWCRCNTIWKAVVLYWNSPLWNLWDWVCIHLCHLVHCLIEIATYLYCFFFVTLQHWHDRSSPLCELHWLQNTLLHQSVKFLTSSCIACGMVVALQKFGLAFGSTCRVAWYPSSVPNPSWNTLSCFLSTSSGAFMQTLQTDFQSSQLLQPVPINNQEW